MIWDKVKERVSIIKDSWIEEQRIKKERREKEEALWKEERDKLLKKKFNIRGAMEKIKTIKWSESFLEEKKSILDKRFLKSDVFKRNKLNELESKIEETVEM